MKTKIENWSVLGLLCIVDVNTNPNPNVQFDYYQKIQFLAFQIDKIHILFLFNILKIYII